MINFAMIPPQIPPLSFMSRVWIRISHKTIRSLDAPKMSDIVSWVSGENIINFFYGKFFGAGFLINKWRGLSGFCPYQFFNRMTKCN
jgi:hypothetical protein